MHHRTISPRVCRASSTISVPVVRHTRITKKDKVKEHETVRVTETGEGWRRVGQREVEKKTESDRSGKHVGLQKIKVKRQKTRQKQNQKKSICVGVAECEIHFDGKKISSREEGMIKQKRDGEMKVSEDLELFVPPSDGTLALLELLGCLSISQPH